MPRDLSRYSCNDPAGEQPKKYPRGPRSDARPGHGRHLIINTGHSDGPLESTLRLCPPLRLARGKRSINMPQQDLSEMNHSRDLIMKNRAQPPEDLFQWSELRGQPSSKTGAILPPEPEPTRSERLPRHPLSQAFGDPSLAVREELAETVRQSGQVREIPLLEELTAHASQKQAENTVGLRWIVFGPHHGAI